MIEIWKDIPNFEGIYQISNTGKVKSIERIVVCSDGQLKPVKERLISFGDNGHGYKFCYLWKNNKSYRHYIHRLVADAFVNNPNPKNYTEINHINSITYDNNYINLEWCNRSLNMKAAYKAGHRDNHKKIKYSNKPIFKYGK
ncbi:putative HNH homing endonuclease [uncultured phage cr91_1]|jgi:hypothetical protein|uniref:HNH homing endonuclease n=1 Tax=uncultured phage cr91_1 TaxID=2986403 RepID=A0AAE7V2L0_9CAUD|nr:putative HNH homing endonuclease [uncultured phage cr91_1]QWM89590.1 putative HNH homing endonuclease [uncultured phage cr91_1]